MTVPAVPRGIRYTLVPLRELLLSAGPFALLAIGLLLLAYLWLDPNPPKRVVLATGPAQSAYDEFGKRYQKALAADGIEVYLLASEGSARACRMRSNRGISAQRSNASCARLDQSKESGVCATV